MAPHRLRRPNTLRVKSGGLQGVRWRIIRRTPTVLIDYLFEVLLTCMCLLSGVALLTNFSTSNVVRQMPDPVTASLGVAYLLAGSTAALGLAASRHGTVLPSGLRLFAFCNTAYLVAVIGYNGWRPAILTALWAILITALAAWRAFLLRSTYLLLMGEAGDRTPP